MMAPPVARRLIGEFSKPGDVILDPFCGSGTVIAEAVLQGRRAIGYDINPLALLIARVKSTPLEPKSLRRAFQQIQRAYYSGIEGSRPEFQNLDFWFKPQVILDLTRLKTAIIGVHVLAMRDFFWVVFSRVVRESSNTRKGEFKLFRLPPEKLEKHRPDVWKLFFQRASEAIEIMEEFSLKTSGGVRPPVVENHDVRKPFALPDSSIDLVLTSPPYGDSQTTVAYGQFSRLSAQWLDLWTEDVDRAGLGGRPARLDGTNSEALLEALNQVREQDEKRGRQVKSFYADFQTCLENIARVVRRGGYAIWVTADRKVKGVLLPTHQFIVDELAAEFSHLHTFVRDIPNKTMPLRNSPTNLSGQVDATMLKEQILVLKKRPG